MTAFVRSASERDLPAINALLERTWHETYDAIYGAEEVSRLHAEWHAPAALKRQLDAPQSEFIVADDGAEIVGMGFARMVDDRTAEVAQLYVDPVAQRQGNGAELLTELMNAFPSARMIVLEVTSENTDALAFYKRFGFAETSRRNDSWHETLTLARELA